MLNCFECLFFHRNTTRQEDAGRKEVGTKQEQSEGKTTRRSTISSQTTTGSGAINNDNNQQQDKHDAKQALTAAAAAKPVVQTVVPTRTPKEELVAKLLGTSGDRCRDNILQCCTDDCDWSFAEAHMTVPGFLDESQKIFHSFPDFHFLIETITERPADGTIVARVRAAGTHTGASFAFGPYPEIAATGTRVVLDPEYVVPCALFSINSVSNTNDVAVAALSPLPGTVI
jgi:ketosteroid isomerase-like protein